MEILKKKRKENGLVSVTKDLELIADSFFRCWIAINCCFPSFMLWFFTCENPHDPLLVSLYTISLQFEVQVLFCKLQESENILFNCKRSSPMAKITYQTATFLSNSRTSLSFHLHIGFSHCWFCSILFASQQCLYLFLSSLFYQWGTPEWKSSLS